MAETTPPDTEFAEPPRRPFLYHLLTIIIGGVVAIVPLASGLALFFDPLRSRGGKKDEDEGNWLRVAHVEAVPDDGIPRQFPVIADRIDAWNRTPNQPIGSVYLRRKPGEQIVECLNAICPHAGCFVAVVDGEEGKRFGCPCHTSAFDLSGDTIFGPSPRAMDPLKVNEELLAETGEIWVDFMNFYPGKHEREAKV